MSLSVGSVGGVRGCSCLPRWGARVYACVQRGGRRARIRILRAQGILCVPCAVSMCARNVEPVTSA
eukprot:8177530-Lingulodinium_polyedra.AAC.1